MGGGDKKNTGSSGEEDELWLVLMRGEHNDRLAGKSGFRASS